MTRPEARTAFKDVHIFIGADGDAYYTARYHNGEAGPRSEGYKGDTEADALAAACKAAARDFPDLTQFVDTATEGDE